MISVYLAVYNTHKTLKGIDNEPEKDTESAQKVTQIL